MNRTYFELAVFKELRNAQALRSRVRKIEALGNPFFEKIHVLWEAHTWHDHMQVVNPFGINIHKRTRKKIRLLLVVFIGYLFHVTVMTQLDTTVSINLPLVILSVVIVGYPRYKAFWVGAVYGILLETMVPGVKLLNLVFYPICAMLMSLFFTDKSAARLQYDMSNHRRGRNRSVYLRTPLCALCAALLYEAVSIIYIAMSSAELTSAFFTRALTDALMTTLTAVVLMWPLRRLLGFGAPVSKAMAKG